MMKSKGTENAVRKDPDSGTDPETPSSDVVMMERMVYENVPSTGYVGMPLDDLSYNDGKGGKETRDTIGGPDVASFVFAEDKTMAPLVLARTSMTPLSPRIRMTWQTKPGNWRRRW